MDEQVMFDAFLPPEHGELTFLNKLMPKMSACIDCLGVDSSLLTVNATKGSTGYTAVFVGTATAFRLKLRGAQQYISFPASYASQIQNNYMELASDAGQKYMKIPVDDRHPIDSYGNLLLSFIEQAVDRYPKEFDCCALYQQCSDAKKCIHADKAFALGCGYRKILNSGRIFYGENRNID